MSGQNTVTIRQSMDMFHDFITTSRAKNTARTYDFAVHLFAMQLEKIGIDPETSPTLLLTGRTFEQFPVYLLNNEQGYSKRSLVTWLAGWNRYRRWLIRERLIPAPDAFEVEALADTIKEVRDRRHARMTRLPKTDDADRIIQAARDIETPSPRQERDLAIALFFYTSGCRAAEVSSLRVKDLDLQSLSGRVIGKGDIEGEIFFTQETANAIQTYWKVRGWAGPNDPVFARHDKGAGKKHKQLGTKAIWNTFNELRELAGIEKGKFSPHWMRHAAAMEVQRTGHDAIKTAKFLRHHGLGTVKVYAEATSQEMRELHREAFGK